MKVSKFQMIFLEALEMEAVANEQLPPPPPAPRRQRERTCEEFFQVMSDLEFVRTFRFSKDAVRHITGLLGVNTFFFIIILFLKGHFRKHEISLCIC